MLIVLGRSRLEKIIAEAVTAAVESAERDAKLAVGAVQSLADIKKQLAEMEIQQAKKQEEWDRREREIEHKVGLERKRQEFEIAQAQRETSTRVREENLAADKERFKSEMDFQRKRLEEEVGSLRKLVSDMMQRLPSAEIYADLSREGKQR